MSAVRRGAAGVVWGDGRRRWLNSLLVSQVLGGYRLTSCLMPATLRRAVINGGGGANESDRSDEQSFFFVSAFFCSGRLGGRAACLHEGATLIRLTVL